MHLHLQVHTDGEASLLSHIPTLHDRCMRLSLLFGRIETVEALVAGVRQHVDLYEEKVSLAERNYKANALKRVLGSIPIAGSVVRQLSQTSTARALSGATDSGDSVGALPLFVAADYFRHPSAHYDLADDD
eukprot:Opistho-2@4595